MNHETALEIELAVASYFNPRRNLIVPNVWWGFGLDHECDVLIMTKSGYCYEVEIKVSKADLKADKKKRHCHSSDGRIKELYFAIPEKLRDAVEFIPERAGILIIDPKGYVKRFRRAKRNNVAPLGLKQRMKLAELGTMRIWTLKKQIRSLAA